MDALQTDQSLMSTDATTWNERQFNDRINANVEPT